MASLEQTAEYFQFLDDLRASGVTNMYGASPYLEDEYGLTKADAKAIHINWMKTFNSKQTAQERAQALKAIS